MNCFAEPAGPGASGLGLLLLMAILMIYVVLGVLYENAFLGIIMLGGGAAEGLTAMELPSQCQPPVTRTWTARPITLPG